MRRLWGRLTSVNVQKAVWGLDETGLPYDRVEAGGAHGVVNDPGYRTMNPNGLVPTLEEDGFVLWESNAILRYLAATGPALALALPADPRARAHVEQWLDWQATSFTPAMRDAFWQLYRAADPDRGLIAASVEKSEAMAEILDIPTTWDQTCLIPVAHVTGDSLKPSARKPVDDTIIWR